MKTFKLFKDEGLIRLEMEEPNTHPDDYHCYQEDWKAYNSRLSYPIDKNSVWQKEEGLREGVDFVAEHWCHNEPTLKGVHKKVQDTTIEKFSKEKHCESCYLKAIPIPKEESDDFYPGKWYQPLFNLMVKEYDQHLLQSEMDDIISVVQKMLISDLKDERVK